MWLVVGPPIWKICSSNWIISPNRGENFKKMKPPPSQAWFEKINLCPSSRWCYCVQSVWPTIRCSDLHSASFVSTAAAGVGIDSFPQHRQLAKGSDGSFAMWTRNAQPLPVHRFSNCKVCEKSAHPKSLVFRNSKKRRIQGQWKSVVCFKHHFDYRHYKCIASLSAPSSSLILVAFV